jgi:lysophospholipid acyltransferase
MSSTVASPPGPTGWEANAADALGVSFSQFRFTVAFFLSVVVGALFRVLPSPRSESVFRIACWAVFLSACNCCRHVQHHSQLACAHAGRHIYAAITGFLLIYYPFGGGVLNALVPAALSYVAMLRFREHAATLTWLTSFGYLLWW